MDERPKDQPETQSGSPARGRRIVTALLVAGALAAVPAGVALAGDSDGSAAGGSNSSGALPAQSTTPDDGQRDRGHGDRGDCPDRHGPGGQESTEL
jgi:hypothetical protein